MVRYKDVERRHKAAVALRAFARAIDSGRYDLTESHYVRPRCLGYVVDGFEVNWMPNWGDGIPALWFEVVDGSDTQIQGFILRPKKS